MADVVRTIEAHVGPVMLVIMRIGGLAVFGPILSGAMIPARVRIMLVFLAGFGAYGLLASNGLAPVTVSLEPLSLLPLAAGEVAIGALIGFIAALPLLALRTGGLICGQQMGLGFARFYNPAAGEETDVIEQLFYFLGLAGFILIGGLEAMFIAVLHSFEYINAGIFLSGNGVMDILIGLLLSSLEIGMRVALPLLGVIFLETIAMGFVSKTVPQLNVLSLGFPLRIMVGLGVVIAGLAIIDQVAMEFLGSALDTLHDWATVPRGEGT